MYLVYTKKKNVKSVSEHYYRWVFNYKFKLSFHVQKKDMCDHCVRYAKIPENRKTELEIKIHNSHVNNKKTPRKLLVQNVEEAKTKSFINVACFDLQKVLTIPKSNNSSFYYSRKLAAFNFTIYDVAKKEGFCYVWNESIGNRGADEIASFVYNYILMKKTEGVTEFHFYSDSCGGQNRNKIIFSMYSKVAEELGVKITHRYFVSGNSQNPGDTMHARIETKAKSQNIFTQEQWCDVICTAVVKKPYTVYQVTNNFIYNFSHIAEKRKWINIPISSVREFYVLPYSNSVFILIYMKKKICK